jgi:predicted nucleic acid-binding protein
MRGAVPDYPPLRIFLDSNILFSASLHEDSDFRDLWRLRDITPITSQYAIGEVSRNIRIPSQQARFKNLLTKTGAVSDVDVRFVPSHVMLVAKDRPILAAAIAASVDCLITGDKNHFAHLYGGLVSGVLILSPADFLSRHNDRLLP